MHRHGKPEARAVLHFIVGIVVSVGSGWVDPVGVRANDKKQAGMTERAEKIEMAGRAKVTIDQAVQAALQAVQGTVIEAELEEKPRVTWEVEIVTADGKVMDVLVDIDTGAVVSVKEDDEEEEAAQKPEEDKGAEKAQSGSTMHRPAGMGMPGCCRMGMHRQGEAGKQ